MATKEISQKLFGHTFFSFKKSVCLEQKKTGVGRWSRSCYVTPMEQHTSKIVSNCFNTNIYSYLETSGGQSLNQYLNVVHFCNTSVILTSVAAQDRCFTALVSIMHCSIIVKKHKLTTLVRFNNYYLNISLWHHTIS